MKKKLFILDVSGFIFRAYFALPPMSNEESVPVHALFGFVRQVLKLMKDFSPEHIVAVYDGPDNKKERRALYDKYKANRGEIVEDLPHQIDLSKEFCDLFGITHIEMGGVEADDTIGSIASQCVKEGITCYLCSSDKDLCQLVGPKTFVLNPWKDNLLINEEKVEEIFGVRPDQIVDLLAMMGDASDNIPGIAGFGPKTAAKLLQEHGTLEELLKHPEKAGGKKTETLREEKDVAQLSQKLATIQTNLLYPDDGTHFARKDPQLEDLRAFYLKMGFHSLVKELEEETGITQKEEPTAYHLVDTEKELEKLVGLLEKAPEIAFDTETTSLRPLQAKVVGIGFCAHGNEATYVPCNGKLGEKRVVEALKPLFSNPKLKFYGHNVKYDMHVLSTLGIRIANLSYDTILASYLLHSSSRRHSLDALALSYFGKVKTSIKELIGTGKKQISMMDVPIKTVSNYCCEDVDYTWRIKQKLDAELKKRELEPLLEELELPLVRVLAKMEETGVFVDVKRLDILSEKFGAEIEQLQGKIYKLAGGPFNLNSPKQLSHILFEKMGIKPLKKTATGFSTNAEVLETLAQEHAIAKLILAFRSLDKLKSTYVDTLPQEINPKTGRVHPTFNQFVAATGRLACQDPNLQNIPVRTAQGREIRKAFRPEKKGYSYLSADYSQIELRLLAHLSGDQGLIKAFKKGEDIHAYTASLMFEVPLDKVSKTQRHQAKAINFGIIYGQQAYGLSRELGIDIKKAAHFIEAYFERYPKVGAYIDTCIELAKKESKSVTMTGRERELPEIHSQNAQLRAAAERLAVNTPLQGSAADLIKIAMLDIDEKLESYESQMILQIHDELIFEVPEGKVDVLARFVKKTMETAFDLDVPLVVDLAIGKNWAEC